MIYYNKFEKKLLESLERNGIPEKGKRVMVGLSGGADSVSLLFSLNRLKNAYPLEVFAVHVNHQLRGEESVRDMQYANDLCDELGIPFYCHTVDVKSYALENKLGIEEAAREVRYNFFREFSFNNQIDYILTAHNKNDVAETILFHIIRGSGIAGLQGISRQRDNIIRPLLCFSREEIEQYCCENSISFVVDSTNNDINYSRNFIRHKIIPDIKKLNPSVVDALYRLSNSITSVNKMIDTYESFCTDMESRDLEDEFLFRRAKNRLSEISDHQLTYNRFMALRNALNNENETILSFPDNVECIVKNGDFHFRKLLSDIQNIDEFVLSEGENLVNDWLMIEISNKILEKRENVYKNSTIFSINCDTIVGGLKVRSRREGDKIRIGDMTRNLKKLFIEKKIPKDVRDLIPVICDEKDILLVPKIGIADKSKIKGQKNIYIGIHSRKVF